MKVQDKVVIRLDEPITIGAKSYSKVVVRPPTYDEYLEFGEISEIEGFTSSGAPVIGLHLDAIRSYAERCVTTGDDGIAEPAVLAAGGMRLARKVREAITGFFRDGEAKGAGATSPKTASSGSDGSQRPSDE